MSDRHTQTSKFLSYVLRHEPQSIGLTLDSEGWADLDALIDGATASGQQLDRALIHAVVAGNDKKRFALSDDGKRIRAVQGHSTQAVAIAYEAKIPPAVLYHGTASRFLASILAEGLRPGQRHHVHLSENLATATEVGRRYGEPVILSVDADAMHAQGFAFFQADNGVWLTEKVPVAFLQRCAGDKSS
jgi:putative RNA 2'-phosphotransferase